jgi:hypothetical protein
MSVTVLQSWEGLGIRRDRLLGVQSAPCLADRSHLREGGIDPGRCDKATIEDTEVPFCFPRFARSVWRNVPAGPVSSALAREKGTV